MHLHFVTLRHVTFTLCCFTLCNPWDTCTSHPGMESTKSKMRDGKKCGNRNDQGTGENVVKGGNVGKEEMWKGRKVG